MSLHAARGTAPQTIYPLQDFRNEFDALELTLVHWDLAELKAAAVWAELGDEGELSPDRTRVVEGRYEYFGGQAR